MSIVLDLKPALASALWVTVAMLAGAAPTAAAAEARPVGLSGATPNAAGPGKSLSMQGRPPLDNEQLAREHGQGIVLSNQTLASAISGNTIGGNYTAGSVSFSDQAFTDFSGVGNITVNTGAQAALQSGVNITINLTN